MAAQTAQLNWSLRTDGDVRSSPAIGADGTIYVGSDDNELHAISESGVELWSARTGGSISSSPALGSDGTVYVGSNDDRVYAFNSNGSVKWTFETHGSVRSSPVVGADRTVYVGSEDNRVYAIRGNGTLKWSFSTQGDVSSSPALSASGSTLYVGSDDDRLYALATADGSLQWTSNLGGDVRSSPAVGADGTIYVGSDRDRLVALRSNGSILWQFDARRNIQSSPALASDGTIYFGTEGVGSEAHRLYALNPNGTLKWFFQATGDIEGSPVVGGDGTVYVGSIDGRLYAVRKNGTLLFSHDTGAAVESSPAIGRNGTVYVGSNSDRLLSIGIGAGCGGCVASSNPCLTTTCDAAVGRCVSFPAEGKSCEDGDPSTSNEICVFGSCVPPRTSTASFCAAQADYEQALRADPIFRRERVEFERHVASYQAQLETREMSLAFGEVAQIPVVFHVLENPSAPTVTDAHIQAQLATLNDDYANVRLNTIRDAFKPIASATRFQFVLAKRTPTCQAPQGSLPGVNRIPTSATEFRTANCDYADPNLGGAAGWPNDKYLNIWIAPRFLGPGFNIRGTSTMPGNVPQGYPPGITPWCGSAKDGVAVLAEEVVSASHVLSHEVGHWMALVHVENPENGTCRGNTAATCSAEGDVVCDTPASTSLFDCSVRNSCTDSPTDPPDQFENLMNSVMSSCRTMFTFGQVARMEGALTYVSPFGGGSGRGSVLNSDGLIPPPTPSTGDPWSRDGVDDTGAEPNPDTSVWHSDDIWVRLQPDGKDVQQHENPVFQSGGQNRVYVYVRVRNRGCQATQPTTITLHWAKASTNLHWPDPWDGSVAAPCPGAPPMGARIGNVSVGALGPGESTVVEIPWDLPNRDAYACFGADQSHFCLLSTIGTVPTAPQDLIELVRQRNDVVWKNLDVVGDTQSLASTSVSGTPDEAPAQLRFEAPSLPGSRSVFDWGTVRVDLGAGLFGRWVEGGMLGTGIAGIQGTTVTLASSGATLESIALRQNDLFTLRVQFVPQASVPRQKGLDIYYLDVTQLAERGTPPPPSIIQAGVSGVSTEVVGAVRFTLKTKFPFPTGGPPPIP